MEFIYNDGGRAAAGFKGSKTIGDCVCRAIAIATSKPYQEVYDDLTTLGWSDRYGYSSGRLGRWFWRDTDGLIIPGEEARRREREYINSLGWHWTPTMKIGTGCRIHLRANELPAGRLIVSVSHHMVAIIDGVIHDTHDCSRDGTRCVYGYFTPAAPQSAHRTWRSY